MTQLISWAGNLGFRPPPGEGAGTELSHALVLSRAESAAEGGNRSELLMVPVTIQALLTSAADREAAPTPPRHRALSDQLIPGNGFGSVFPEEI